MIITTRTNLHLWLLTGRCEDFKNVGLNSGIRYRSGPPPDEVVAARELLKLNNTASDFYVLGALAAVTASAPFLRRLPVDSGLAFSEDLVQLPANEVVGAEVVSDSASWDTFDGSIAGREGFTELTVTKHGNSVIVRRDSGSSTFEDFSLVGNTLTIPALRNHGVNAKFSVGGWSDGQHFTIKLAQTGYPYDKFAAAAADSSKVAHLMLEEGTMEAFASAVRPIHKVGALACAVMQRMAAISASADSEFSVEADSSQLEEYVLRQLSVDWSPITLDDAPVAY